MSAPTALLGQQAPRLQLVPPDVTNAAQDAIDVYEMTGGRLDPWQELCLRVGCGERADCNWSAFEVGVICQRQNGKGACIEALCLASLFIWGNQVTIYSAHHGDTVRKTFRGLKNLIEGTPDLARRCKPINDSDDVIELIGGARLEFRTRTRAGGRGLTGDLVILDEALELNPDQIASLVPVMLARPYAQLWYFSTVPQAGDQHLCKVRTRVLADSPRLAWVEWGVERGEDLTDPAVLARANPALGIRITLERLQDLRGILGEDKFATECCGIWPLSLAPTQVLDPAAWKLMADVASRRAPGSDLVLSLDMTPMRDHGSIGLHALRADGLEHMQLTDYEAGVDWMVARAAELHAALNPVLWVLDRKNGAFALVAALAAVGIKVAADPESLNRGELLILELQDVATAVGQFVDGFRKVPAVFRHIGQDPLDLAISNAKPRPIGDAGQIAWGRKLSEVDIGPLVVVTQARYGSQMWMTRQAKKIPRSKVW